MKKKLKLEFIPIDEKRYGEKWGYLTEDKKVIPKSKLNEVKKFSEKRAEDK